MLVTTDGGRHWRNTGQVASAISALADGSALAILTDTTAGPRFAVTHNWGKSWRQLTPLADVQTRQLLGSHGWHDDITDAGTFVSTDGGARWTALDPRQLDVHSTLLTAQPGLIATLDSSNERCAPRVSSDGGVSWRTVAPPGGTLRRIDVPPGGGGAYENDCPSQPLAFAFGSPHYESCIGSAAYANQLWETCIPAAPRAKTTIYHSRDGGRVWRAYTISQAAFTPTYIIATGPDQAIAGGPTTSGGLSTTPSLWKTSDGGRTWTQTWPDLPIGSDSPPLT